MLRIGSMIAVGVNGVYLAGTAWFLMLVLTSGWLPPQFTHLLSWEEILSLSPRLFAAAKYTAIIFYSVCIGYGLLIHMVIWKGLLKGQQWGLWTVVAAWGTVAITTSVADLAFGGLLPPLNGIYNVAFLIGIAAAGYGLYKPADSDLTALPETA